MILWLLFGFLVFWVVSFKLKRRRMYKLASLIPAPKRELPIIGIAHTFAGNTEDIMVTLQEFSYETMQHNGILRVWLNHILYFVLTNPVDMEWVLKTCLEKDNLHRFLRKVTGNGGIFAPVPIWRTRRKVLVPVFSPKNVESFVKILSEQSENLTKALESQSNQGTFSIWPFLSSYTLDSVCETTMGVTVNALNNPNSPFLKSINRILNLVCERIFHLWLQPDWLYKLFPQYQEYEQCVNILFNYVDKVIEQKRRDLETEKEGQTIADYFYDIEEYRRKSFLDLLISASGGEKGYTNVELREEMLTLVVAGTDTTAVTIGNVLKLLAKYPEVQEKICTELYEVFGNFDRPLEKKDLVKLKYMECVVKETLRLFPPVPFIIRKVLTEITLPSGRVLPAGSGVVCSIWGVHRDPKYWGSDAEHFNPDRFLPERFNLAHACSFMPFSNGPRNCIGYQYAMMSVKTSLAAIFRRYRVVEEKYPSPTPNMRVKLDITMKAVDGYQTALKNNNMMT